MSWRWTRSFQSLRQILANRLYNLEAASKALLVHTGRRSVTVIKELDAFPLFPQLLSSAPTQSVIKIQYTVLLHNTLHTPGAFTFFSVFLMHWRESHITHGGKVITSQILKTKASSLAKMGRVWVFCYEVRFLLLSCTPNPAQWFSAQHTVCKQTGEFCSIKEHANWIYEADS